MKFEETTVLLERFVFRIFMDSLKNVNRTSVFVGHKYVLTDNIAFCVFRSAGFFDKRSNVLRPSLTCHIVCGWIRCEHLATRPNFNGSHGCYSCPSSETYESTQSVKIRRNQIAWPAMPGEFLIRLVVKLMGEFYFWCFIDSSTILCNRWTVSREIKCKNILLVHVSEWV